MNEVKQKAIYVIPKLGISTFDCNDVICVSGDEAGTIPEYIYEEW